MTGIDTLSFGSRSLASLRATWSAPPPGPHGTMNSTGLEGNSSAATILEAILERPTAKTAASETRRLNIGIFPHLSQRPAPRMALRHTGGLVQTRACRQWSPIVSPAICDVHAWVALAHRCPLVFGIDIGGRESSLCMHALFAKGTQQRDRDGGSGER